MKVYAQFHAAGLILTRFLTCLETDWFVRTFIFAGNQNDSSFSFRLVFD